MLEKNDKINEINTTIIEDITPYYTDVFSPWETKQQLELWKEVKNIDTWWKFYCWNSSNKNWHIWTQIISWIWFKPKMVSITAVYATSSWWSISYWQSNINLNQFSIYSMSNPNAWATSYTSWNIINCDWQYSWNWSAILTSLDNDWFTLNWISIVFDVTFMYQCYW